jgi:hypothetical protein
MRNAQIDESAVKENSRSGRWDFSKVEEGCSKDIDHSFHNYTNNLTLNGKRQVSN